MKLLNVPLGAWVCQAARTATLVLATVLGLSARADSVFLRGGEKLIGRILSDEVDVDVHETIQRRTPNSRLNLDYLGNYWQLNSDEFENDHRAIGQFDSFLLRRLYVRMPDLEYFRDSLQNLQYRVTAGAGVGYELVKTPRSERSVTASPAWQHNRYVSVPVGESSSADSAALVLSTITTWNSRADSTLSSITGAS